MELSGDLLKRFVQVTNDKEPKKKETTVYGTVVKNGESTYVKLDGSSNTLTPAFLGVCADNNDRVIVNIKNHSATITNNLTSPPKTGIYSEILNENFNIITGRIASIEMITSKAITTDTLSAALVDAGYISAEEIHSEYIRADELVSKIATIDSLTANDAFIKNIQTVAIDANYIKSAVANVGYLTADSAVITSLQTDKLNISEINAKVADLGYLTADSAVITGKLDANQLSAEVAKLGYLDAKMANIDFANLNKSNIGQLFANVGLISSATITDGHVTGYLDSVEVNANKITAGTLAVDRLLIKDSSGNYKMATYDSSGNLVTTTVNGSVITNRTITADHLVAGTITANEINMTNLVGNSAFINAINTNSIVVSASNNASSALSTANTANSNASNALNTANSANTTANSASSTANSALSTANTANSNASSAISTANNANTKAQGIIDNIYTPNTTTINGGKITTGSIKAAQIDVNDLFAQNITASGTITGGSLVGSTITSRKNSSTENIYITINEGKLESWNGYEVNAKFEGATLTLENGAYSQTKISSYKLQQNDNASNSTTITSGILTLSGGNGTGVLKGNELTVTQGSSSSIITPTSITENGTALSNKYAPISHSHDYLPLSGGTITGSIYTSGNIRIGQSGDHNLYLGSASNAGWLIMQDMMSQASTCGWKLHQSGSMEILNNLTVGTIAGQSTYTIGVSGTLNATTIYENGTALSNKYLGINANAVSATKATQDGNGNVIASTYIPNFGSNPTYGNGSALTQPGGTAALSIRTTTGASDVGIFYLSQDNCYIANSSDDSYTFGVFDTDLTKNMADVNAASFVVLSGGTGAKIRGQEVIHSGNIGDQSVNYANSAGSAPASDVYSWAKQSTKPSYALNEITGSSDIFKVVTYSYNSVSVASGSSATVTPSRTNIPSGYTAVAVYTVNSGGGRIYPRAHSADGTIVLVNESSAATVTPSMKVLCVKSICVG